MTYQMRKVGNLRQGITYFKKVLDLASFGFELHEVIIFVPCQGGQKMVSLDQMDVYQFDIGLLN